MRASRKINFASSADGFILISTLLLTATFLALLAAYFLTNSVELATTRYSRSSTTGFYASEAGLNVRAEAVRQKFVGFNVPSGTSPNTTNPCKDSNQGTGDFKCETKSFDNRSVTSYIQEEPGNPLTLTIPPGELYQNLSAMEYRYTTLSSAKNISGDTEAMLELRFKSRLVPLFQFAAFYNKDLEILPGPTMTLAGPVHTNGDLYLNTDNTSPGLSISGQVTAAGKIYRGRKNDNTCLSNPVKIFNPTTGVALKPTCPSRTLITTNDTTPYNGMLKFGVDVVTVPAPEVFNPTPGQVYWDKADLRLVLHLKSDGTPDTTTYATGVEVRNSDDSINAALSTKINTAATCPGNISGRTVGNSNTFKNNRENKTIRMLEVDMRTLLDCIHNQALFGASKDLNDSSEGGIVFHFTVKGPNSATVNNYGVRVRNADPLQATNASFPKPVGLSIISDQAMYIRGDFNKTSKIPAAVMVDVINILSNNWNFSNDASLSTGALSSRVPTDTTVQAAFLSGTDTTGGVEGSGGQGGAYNGGLENYPRFHEDWSGAGKKFTYVGSFVSLGKPKFSSGTWVYGSPQYTAPTRAWTYDTMFNDGAKLPPITPRFVYLRQELFVRDFEQD